MGDLKSAVSALERPSEPKSRKQRVRPVRVQVMLPIEFSQDGKSGKANKQKKD